MSYTNEVKTVNQRMNSLEQVIYELKRDQKEGFERLSKEVESLKSGIHGNSEHDQIGYRQRINELESTVREHDELKKKVLFAVSWTTGAVTLIINAVILFAKSLWT